MTLSRLSLYVFPLHENYFSIYLSTIMRQLSKFIVSCTTAHQRTWSSTGRREKNWVYFSWYLSAIKHVIYPHWHVWYALQLQTTDIELFQSPFCLKWRLTSVLFTAFLRHPKLRRAPLHRKGPERFRTADSKLLHPINVVGRLGIQWNNYLIKPFQLSTNYSMLRASGRLIEYSWWQSKWWSEIATSYPMAYSRMFVKSGC